LTGLEYCVNLIILQLNYNNLRDISPLSGLTNLVFLGLGYNRISDIGPLSELDKLTSLGLAYNNISDLSPLSELDTPWALILSFNNISNIQPLLDNSEINAGDNVYLIGNPLSDEALADISTLEDRGVNVYFFTAIEENLIAVIEDWDLSGGTENSLIARLRSANRALLEHDWPTMSKCLYAFMDRCEKMRGTKLTDEQADYLIAEAEWIIEEPI
jgi:Leucine-rich repeat (LRR) protein